MSNNNSNKKSLFWTSYSDLMTSLFFAMLVLFVVVVVAMGRVNKDLKDAKDKAVVQTEQYERIIHLKDQFNSLTESGYLYYDDDKCMFYVKDFVGIEIFKPYNLSVNNIDEATEIKPEYIETVDNVGKEIKSIITTLNKNGNFKFQLVIEGTAAIPYKDLIAKTFNPDNKNMYLLSYRRALALYERWKHLNLRDSNTEVIIAGSGFNGINRDTKNEDNNKRFVIQIIPKIDRPSN
jgi:hypothetical protein